MLRFSQVEYQLAYNESIRNDDLEYLKFIVKLNNEQRKRYEEDIYNKIIIKPSDVAYTIKKGYLDMTLYLIYLLGDCINMKGYIDEIKKSIINLNLEKVEYILSNGDISILNKSQILDNYINDIMSSNKFENIKVLI